MNLTAEQTKVHESALDLAKQHRHVEATLVRTLREVERLKVHKQLGKRSLFQYATEILKLDEHVAYALITIARRSIEMPALQLAIVQKSLSVSKASRIVASLTSQNANELIHFAETHTKSEIEFEIAKRTPKARTRDKMKPVSEDTVEIKATISRTTFEKLKRAESLAAQRNQPTGWGSLLECALEEYLQKNDPVKKAERALAKQKKLGPGRVDNRETSKVHIESKQIEPRTLSKKRIRPTAAQKHTVFARDQGRCTHIDVNGHRCNEDRWLDTHHIISVSNGGTNDPENLTTLCSFHHDLVHQLSLPIDGQVTWLRSPNREYKVGS